MREYSEVGADILLMHLAAGRLSYLGDKVQIFYNAWCQLSETDKVKLHGFVEKRIPSPCSLLYRAMIDAFMEWDEAQNLVGAPGWDCEDIAGYVMSDPVVEEIGILLTTTDVLWREFARKELTNSKASGTAASGRTYWEDKGIKRFLVLPEETQDNVSDKSQTEQKIVETCSHERTKPNSDEAVLSNNISSGQFVRKLSEAEESPSEDLKENSRAIPADDSSAPKPLLRITDVFDVETFEGNSTEDATPNDSSLYPEPQPEIFSSKSSAAERCEAKGKSNTKRSSVLNFDKCRNVENNVSTSDSSRAEKCCGTLDSPCAVSEHDDKESVGSNGSSDVTPTNSPKHRKLCEQPSASLVDDSDAPKPTEVVGSLSNHSPSMGCLPLRLRDHGCCGNTRRSSTAGDTDDTTRCLDYERQCQKTARDFDEENPETSSLVSRDELCSRDCCHFSGPLGKSPLHLPENRAAASPGQLPRESNTPVSNSRTSLDVHLSDSSEELSYDESEDHPSRIAKSTSRDYDSQQNTAKSLVLRQQPGQGGGRRDECARSERVRSLYNLACDVVNKLGSPNKHRK